MDTPQSIGTLSSDTIEALGATDMRGLFQNITGLNMSERELAGGNRYTIRGVSSPTGHEPSAQTSAAVSVYLDDVPMTSAQSPVQQFGGNMFDMERVEVTQGSAGHTVWRRFGGRDHSVHPEEAPVWGNRLEDQG